MPELIDPKIAPHLGGQFWGPREPPRERAEGKRPRASGRGIGCGGFRKEGQFCDAAPPHGFINDRPQHPASPRSFIGSPMAVPDGLRDALADRYALERELGRGGMAVVYLAQDLRHDRPVALKVLLPELAATLGPERFQREIRLAARLQHPHILTVHDSGEAAGRLWFTMPFVEGESLRDRLRREGRLPVNEALRITLDAAQALQYAHEQGIIHRDVKPENLLLTPDGNTLVADFGIARAADSDEHITRGGATIGTPAYMSPEQADGAMPVDARTDVYSLAAVLYEMLAGAPPYAGTTAMSVIAKWLSEPVPSARAGRPEVPEGVDRAIRRALSRSAGERFGTMAEFACALTED